MVVAFRVVVLVLVHAEHEAVEDLAVSDAGHRVGDVVPFHFDVGTLVLAVPVPRIAGRVAVGMFDRHAVVALFLALAGALHVLEEKQRRGVVGVQFGSQRRVAFGQSRPLFVVLAPAVTDRVALLVHVFRCGDFLLVVVVDERAVLRDVLDLDRFDVDEDVVLEFFGIERLRSLYERVFGIERERDLGGRATEPCVQLDVRAVDLYRRSVAFFVARRFGRREVTRHLVVLRDVVLYPFERYGLERLFRVDLFLVTAVGGEVAHVGYGVDAVLPVRQRAGKFGVLRLGFGRASRTRLVAQRRELIGRKILAAHVPALVVTVRVVPHDEDVADGFDGIASEAAGPADRRVRQRMECRVERHRGFAFGHRPVEPVDQFVGARYRQHDEQTV